MILNTALTKYQKRNKNKIQGSINPAPAGFFYDISNEKDALRRMQTDY